MKNECDIVEDLLFSYNDDILTNASKEFVEEHLKKCDKCKKVLEEIKKYKELLGYDNFDKYFEQYLSFKEM